MGDIYYNYKKSLEKDFSVKKDGDSNEDNTSSKSKTKVKSNRKKSDEFILNYHGGRDLYNIIKIFSSEMLEKNMPDDEKIKNLALTKSLARNLNGLEIEGKSSLKTYIKDNDINFDNLRTMDLVIENIKSKDTRFLLLASEKSMFGFLIILLKKN